ncbi:DUF6173 family protein [Sporosarcina sp. FSL K6-2383]|uniref:DUF6173 family protein n=1 Tax=Sporosarcina sp. FSL K6-2383 TaxID=2921556 RepID=UPI00315B11DC
MTSNLPEIPQLAPTSDNDAATIANQVVAAVNAYNRNLNHDQEVGLMLTSFGQTMTVNITGIGYIGTRLIIFKGFLTNNNAPVELLQHVSQLNFLLVSLKRENPLEEKKHIGFLGE